jgi:hypothetical protein
MVFLNECKDALSECVKVEYVNVHVVIMHPWMLGNRFDYNEWMHAYVDNAFI